MAADDSKKSVGLDNFISLIKNTGLSQVSHFSAVLYPPPMMKRLKLDLSKFALLCDTASIPGISFMTNDVAVYGEARQMPTQRLFSDISLTFYVDLNLVIKKYFDDWTNLIIDPKTRSVNYYREYVSHMDIIVHDKNHNVKYKVTLNECYPKSIRNIGLDYNDHNPMKLSVEFQYKDYVVHNLSGEGEQLELKAFLKDSLNTDVLGSIKRETARIDREHSSTNETGSPLVTLPEIVIENDVPKTTLPEVTQSLTNPDEIILPTSTNILSTTIDLLNAIL